VASIRNSVMWAKKKEGEREEQNACSEEQKKKPF
jgi:hypothetical protein